MADDIDQQLVDVRKEIQEAKIEKTAALANGDTSYAAALVAHLTSLQNKELFLMQLQQQNQGEQRCAMHGEIVTSQRNLDTIKRRTLSTQLREPLEL